MTGVGQGGLVRGRVNRVLSHAAAGLPAKAWLRSGERGLRCLGRAAAGCVLWFAVGTPAALAADDSQVIFPGGSATPPPGPTAATGGTFNTVTLFLAVLLAIAGAWLYWRNRRQPGLNRGATALAVEETKALGNRQYLVVASYEGKRFLLGVCPGKIDLLAPLGERGEPKS